MAVGLVAVSHSLVCRYFIYQMLRALKLVHSANVRACGLTRIASEPVVFRDNCRRVVPSNACLTFRGVAVCVLTDRPP